MTNSSARGRPIPNPSIDERIAEALIKLLHEQPLTEISVKELCACAYVARSTFYAHFRNTDEVMQQIETSVVADLAAINEPLAEGARSTAADFAFFQDTLDYLAEHREVMGVLLVERPSARFSAAWKEAIKEHLLARRPLAIRTPEDDFALDMAASAMVNAAAYFVEHDAEIDEEFARAAIADVLAIMERPQS